MSTAQQIIETLSQYPGDTKVTIVDSAYKFVEVGHEVNGSGYFNGHPAIILFRDAVYANDEFNTKVPTPPAPVELTLTLDPNDAQAVVDFLAGDADSLEQEPSNAVGEALRAALEEAR